MSESITLSLPRTKCEHVRVLFTRIRLLFGVSVEPDVGSTLQEQGPPGQGCVMTSGTKTVGPSSENLRLTLTMIEGGPEQLNKAKDYLLAACSDTNSRCERRCQYAPDIFAHLVPMRDEVERECSAMVRFEAQDGLVLIGGQERNVLQAIRFLDAKAQDIVVARSKRPTDLVTTCGPILSQVGVQSREVFRQCRNLESEDSSYDSDYENAEPATPQDGSYGSRHDDVSRTVSDTLAAEFAEYVTLDPEGGRPLRDLATILADPNYTSRVEFALKLGYTESQVQIALQKLGAQPSQNELLAELIKLGNQPATIAGLDRAKDSSKLEELDLESGCEIQRLELADDSVNLRHIVIDGSNVAMSHGNKECFSCRGIKLCVDWFRARGHHNITVFVPRWRKEVSRPDAPIKDQEILAQLEKDRQLVFTPSRHVGGRRMVCYDDRYILRLAVDLDGVVVSNDNYRDLAQENPDYKRIVEDRLLMYSFVNDRFMPPDDPLGRHGPSLDNFLRKTNVRTTEPLPPPCPYGKKCTYGNKCKFYHPERGNQPQKSVTERLAEQAKIPLQEVKSRGLKSRESSPGDKLKSASANQANNGKLKKQPLSRTKSLIPSSSLVEGTYEKINAVERTKSDGSAAMCHDADAASRRDQAFFQSLVSSSFSPTGVSWPSAMPQISLSSASCPVSNPSTTTVTSSWAALSSTLPPNIPGSCAEMFLEPDSGGHLFVAKRLSDPDSHGNKSAKSYSASQMTQEAGSGNLHRKLQRQLSLNPTYDPRLMQLGGYAGHRLLSPQQEQYPILQQQEQSALDQRTSSYENLHNMQRGFRNQPSHQPLTRMGSDGRVASTLHAASHMWEGIGSEHQTVTRIASAPDSNLQWPHLTKMQHLNSTSDTRLNLYPDFQRATLQPSPLAATYREGQPQRHWMSQGHGLEPPRPMSPAGLPMIGTAGASWQEQMNTGGIARGSSHVIGQPVRPSSVPPHGMQLGGLSIPPRPQTPELPSDARYKLEFHLSSIFPKEQVRAAMEMYPQETNPQKICAAILSMFPKG